MLNVICRHNCKDCFAMRACAVHAIKDQQGSIYVESSECIGCGCCKRACVTFGYKTLQNKAVDRLKGVA